MPRLKALPDDSDPYGFGHHNYEHSYQDALTYTDGAGGTVGCYVGWCNGVTTSIRLHGGTLLDGRYPASFVVRPNKCRG